MILFGDVTHVLGPFGTYATQVLHAKTAALVYPNISGITDGATAIAELAQDRGRVGQEGRLRRELDRPDRPADQRRGQTRPTW